MSLNQKSLFEKGNPYWRLPELDDLENIPLNKKTRVETFKKLKTIGPELIKHYEMLQHCYQAQVELYGEETVGIGEGVADIQLSQSEIDNLLKIKELLNGCKIVLTKGDIRIEVE